ncbi:MAG: hypothetical protein HOP08_13800 [Cyclobacteriaceae bacterium]|nr:hypothetical protein [Cyclobacteriaceae bacterium]
MRWKIFLSLFLTLIIQEAHGWIYSEHRRAFIHAIQRLNEQRKAGLDNLWHEATDLYKERLSRNVIEPDQNSVITKLDYASWAAIAGDHSCSPADLLTTVLHNDWILSVAKIAAETEDDIKQSRSSANHNNIIHKSDIRLQRADREYASRAGSNNAHFLIARYNERITSAEYLAASLRDSTEINALSIYWWFHSSALYKAQRYRSEHLSKEQNAQLILGALADEAFAIHFLEDIFSSGHFAGTWGETAIRKGTHDYYCEHGLESMTWDGHRKVFMGDGYMRDEDIALVSRAVTSSLEQFLDVILSNATVEYSNDILCHNNGPDSTNICNASLASHRPVKNGVKSSSQMFGSIEEIFRTTPVPGLATGLGELPRFRAEIGPFIGVAAAGNISRISSGFGAIQNDKGFVGGLDFNITAGLGLDGVLNEAGDGLFFVQLGMRQDASSTSLYSPLDVKIPPGSLTSAIPGRGAINIRLRMPFWLIPGDLLLAAPVLLIVSPRSLERMGVTAVNGGLIPWQLGVRTPVGRFQFIAGREVGISFYGQGWIDPDALLIPTEDFTSVYIVSYTSTKFDFPLLEYRPIRTFTRTQSTSVLVQLSTGFDVPSNVKSLDPSNLAIPSMQTVHYVSLRLIFEWRKYIRSKL